MPTPSTRPRFTAWLAAHTLMAAIGVARAGGTVRVASVDVERRVDSVAPRAEGSSKVRDDDDSVAATRRRLAHEIDVAALHGKRDTRDIALDDEIADAPFASSRQDDAQAILATDGDDTTAWRGAESATSWTWTLPFRRSVHLGLVRAHFGDGSARGVPGEWRWEVQPPVDGICQSWGLWVEPRGGKHDDRDGNTFLYGPRETHAQKQAFFADADACGVRLVVTASDGGPPVLRELRILEGAPSLTREKGARVTSTEGAPAMLPSSTLGVIDGTYEGMWSGQVGASEWSISVRLPASKMIDRLRLVLGHDAITVPRSDGRPGRTYSAAYMPLRYRIETSFDDDPAHLLALPEGDAPTRDGAPLAIRRRLVRFAPRPVQLIRLTITSASGPLGETDPTLAAPIVRELAAYAADDPRPVVSEPLFLSVDANPAELTDSLKGGEASADGIFARDASHRLRRIMLGWDADTRWPADASRPRDLGTGRFLEVIEGDDPTLDRGLLEAMSPPPIVLLSGSFDWEFDRETAPSAKRHGHWSWDVLASPRSSDRGMGQLRDAVKNRAAPFVGFCGGAQILALFDAPPDSEMSSGLDGAEPFDAVLLRNENRPIRGLVSHKDPYERAWWSDADSTDAARPVIRFNPLDPLFDTGEGGHLRAATSELPSSHGDMIRLSAFASLFPDLEVVAESDFCRPWVDADGPEPTWKKGQSRCVSVPQAFRSRESDRYPLIGFQFHPEQRDLTRLLPSDPPDARGDALSVLANAIDLTLDSYLHLYWPDA